MARRINRIWVAPCLWALATSGTADATVLLFEVNPVQSTFSLSGTLRGPDGLFPIQQPVAGSLRTNYEGFVFLDSDLSQVDFRGGPVDAQVDGLYLPGPMESDYGIAWATPGGTTFGAFRDFVFSIRGLSTPLSNGFDMSTVTVEITGGTLETTRWPSTILVGAESVFVAGSGMLFDHDTGYTMNLPLTAAFTQQVAGSPYTLEYTISGIIVATQVFPEPGTLTLLAAGTLVMVAGRRIERV